MCHLLPGRDGQDECGKDRKGVSRVGGPALDLGAHGQTEERDQVGQREGLIVLFWVAENET